MRLSRQGQQGNDQGLQVLYYQFGRYLMIASSRPGSQATNLQGIWNDHVQPPWGSNYTVNINTQMNYWLAENANLSELHQPLFDFIGRLAINGAQTAKVNYGITPGWSCTTTPISGRRLLLPAATTGTRGGRRAGRPGPWPGPG